MIEIYTDGSCTFSDYVDSPGSWAFAVIEDNKVLYEEKEFIEKGATNNRMELTGFLKALEWIRFNFHRFGDTSFSIYCDSQIVVKGFNGEWKRKANTDIWEELMDLVKVKLPSYIDINAIWVKGHSGNQWNEYVDKLCTSCYPTTEPEPKVDKSDWKVKSDKTLLKEILVALNSLVNSKVKSEHFTDTYSICTELQKHLK